MQEAERISCTKGLPFNTGFMRDSPPSSSLLDNPSTHFLLTLLKMYGLGQSSLCEQESLASSTVPSAVSTLALAAIFVCLRFASRRLSKAGLWFDDWIQIPALVRSPHLYTYIF